MTADWLTFQSFQRSQQLVKAINTLSIHLKLTLTGVADEERSEQVNESIGTIEAFLEKLECAASDCEQADGAVIVGVDPRLQELVHSYLSARRGGSGQSRLFTEPIWEIRALLSSRAPEDQRALVQCLAELRTLVEEHMHDDLGQLLGAI